MGGGVPVRIGEVCVCVCVCGACGAVKGGGGAGGRKREAIPDATLSP